MAEVPLYKDKKYVELLDKVLKRLKEGYENNASYLRPKKGGGHRRLFLDGETYNRAVNALLAQPNRAFLKVMDKFQDSDIAQFAYRITTAEDGLLRKFQAVLGMEAHHILPQNVMTWLKNLDTGRALEALHEYRKQGGTTGVVPENIKIGSKMGHRAWKSMGLLKDAAGDAVKGVRNLVSAHVNPFTLLDDPKFFQGGFDRLVSLLNKEGQRFKPNQFFTDDDPIQFIVDTIKEQAGEPGKLFAKALDSPFEKQVQEYFTDLLGTNIFKLAESGADPGLVKKYNQALNALKLDYNKIFKALAEGKKPPAWGDEVLDVIDNFNASVKSGQAWSQEVLLAKLRKIKPETWYRNPIVGRTAAGRVVRGALPVIGIGADVTHAGAATMKAVQEPTTENIMRSGSSIVNLIDQTGFVGIPLDTLVHRVTEEGYDPTKGPEGLLTAAMEGAMLTSTPADKDLASFLVERQQKQIGSRDLVKYKKVKKNEEDKDEYGYAPSLTVPGV